MEALTKTNKEEEDHEPITQWAIEYRLLTQTSPGKLEEQKPN